MPPQPPGANDYVDYPDYADPHGEMPMGDEDTPQPHGQQPEPDLDDDPIELGPGGDPPSVPPGGETWICFMIRPAEDLFQELSTGTGTWLWPCAGSPARARGVHGLLCCLSAGKKAGALTPATQQKYSKEIRAAKSEEFKRQVCLGPTNGQSYGDSVRAGHYILSSRMVVVQLPPDIGLPPWMVGLCWNRLDKNRPELTNALMRRNPNQNLLVYLEELALHNMSCYAHDEESRVASDRAEDRSYMSCSDIAQFNTSTTKKMADYAWRPVTDQQKLLGFLGSVASKKRGWFPYQNGHALISHRATVLTASR
ncbi:unnamed protein product [Symbiodinium necroappetens]|uniref:Uncharacterized protein n=1 Tax=Symbiodinium necroappetens TaxID=1628268 RepID=A0A813A5W2_9DINO|nr:unnamed protein product [Symbiodinium necroappetens]